LKAKKLPKNLKPAQQLKAKTAKVERKSFSRKTVSSG